MNAWRREHPEPDQPLTPVERAQVKELEDEIRRLRMENDFLKKAAAGADAEPYIRELPPSLRIACPSFLRKLYTVQ